MDLYQWKKDLLKVNQYKEVFLNHSLPILQGKGKSSFYRIYIISIVILFLVICHIAQVLNPGHYFVLFNSVSEQGGIGSNPRGHLFFNIGAMLIGIFEIPGFLFLYQIFRKFKPIIALISMICAFLGSIGFCFVGIFPQDTGLGHKISSGFAFLGLLISANLNLITYFMSGKHKKIRIIIRIVLIMAPLIYDIAFYLMVQSFYIKKAEIVFNSILYVLEYFPLWEWIVLFAYIFWLLAIFSSIHKLYES